MTGATPAFTLPDTLTAQGFALRAETDADTPFLMSLYATTRAHDMAFVPHWSAEQKQAFIGSQFLAQRHHYRTHFPDSAFDIITRRDEPVGRLYLDTRPSALHIIDIALLPDWCGKGIGTATLRALADCAHANGRRVDIFVERYNPALRLYRRLGFTVIAEHPVYLEMEWTAATPADQLNIA